MIELGKALKQLESTFEQERGCIMSTDVSTSTIFILSLQMMGNGASALPSPWGKIASNAFPVLSQLMSLFGASQPTTAVLIQEAITELEDFWTERQIQTGTSSVEGFLNWYRLNCASSQSLTQPADKEYIETQLLPMLRDQFNPALEGSSFSQLNALSTDNYVAPETWIATADDTVLHVLCLAVTALSDAFQMTILLQAQLASFGMPNLAAGPSDLASDQQFQDNTGSWLNVAQMFNTFLAGSGGSLPANPNVQTTATISGWPAALQQLVNNRRAARLALVTPITKRIVHGVDIGPVFSYNDQLTGYSYSSDLGLTPEQGQLEAEQDRDRHINNINIELDSAFAQTEQIIQSLQKLVYSWQSKMPPAQPSQNGITITFPEDSNKNAADDPLWKGMSRVRYGVSFSNENGPSLRSDWQDCWELTEGKSNPEVSGLPMLSEAQVKAGWGRQIWRQLSSPRSDSSQPEKTPVIRVYDDGSSSSYHDQ